MPLADSASRASNSAMSVFDSTFENRFRLKLQRLPNNHRLAPQLIAPISSSNAILNMMAETAEEISRRPEIRKELQRTTGEKRPEKVKARGRDKFWFLIHALILAGCAVAYWFFTFKLIPLPESTLRFLGRILRGTALIVIVLAIARMISVYALGRIEESYTRFTLQCVLRLIFVL